MKLDGRVMRLIAVGASVTANCQPCLETNVRKAGQNGADEREIAEAIEIGKMVRRAAAAKMDKFASSLGAPAMSVREALEAGCDCSG